MTTDEFDCYRIAPAFTPEPDPQSGLKIAAVTSRALNFCLSFEAQVVEVSPANLIALQDSDFLLIETSVSYDSPPTFTSKGASWWSMLPVVLTEARKNNLPVVFWVTGPASDVEPYIDHINNADLILVSNYSELGKLKKHIKSDAIEYFPPAVQPALHNPFRFHGCHKGWINPLLFISWADLIEYPEYYSNRLKKFSSGFSVVENGWSYKPSKLDDFPDFSDKFLGKTNQLQLAEAMKQSEVVSLLSASLSSVSRREFFCFEAVACGSWVITDDLKDNFGAGFSNILRVCVPEIEEVLSGLESEKLLHLARRELYEHHTYRERLKQISRCIGLKHKYRDPMASIITATKRSKNFENILKNFNQQNYMNKELIIIVNSSEKNFVAAKEFFHAAPNVRVFHLSPENNIGACLNYGLSLARGEFWQKMDDDDWYAPNYLKDMILSWGAMKSDIVGKPLSFIYFEEDDSLHVRRSSRNRNLYGSNEYCSGATLAGSINSARQLPFSTSIRSSVDSMFLESCFRVGYKVLLSDCFNMCVFRSEDTSSHTWQIAATKAQAWADKLDSEKSDVWIV